MSVNNPLYLVQLLLISRLVQYGCSPMESKGLRLPFWRISILILLFSTLFNMLTAHIGSTVLYTLPASWPLIGGQLTLEAAVFGFINGLRLISLLSFFWAFNAIVPASDLAGMTPGALYELGLVMLIAITYIPETARQFQRIRDAQAIRGHRLSGLRAWGPVLIPLLVAGMERALNLSETMVARGYGSTTHHRVPARPRLLLLFGLILVLGGGLRLAWSGSDGWAILWAGAAVIGWAYHNLSRQNPRTKYRPVRWTYRETVVLAGACISLICFLPGFDHSSLVFAPYPTVSLPPFEFWVGLALLGLGTPIILAILPNENLETAR